MGGNNATNAECFHIDHFRPLSREYTTQKDFLQCLTQINTCAMIYSSNSTEILPTNIKYSTAFEIAHQFFSYDQSHDIYKLLGQIVFGYNVAITGELGIVLITWY